MGIVGWIHPARDLRRERPTLSAMARAFGGEPGGADVIRLERSAGFAGRGIHFGLGDGPPHSTDPDASLLVALDGRLTSHERLHAELSHGPRPDLSDAGLLLDTYRRCGARLVDSIDGRYAIAVWDSSRQQLLLVRDRFGIKTWYYRCDNDGGLVFATTVRALLAHPDVTAVLDADGLNELLTMGPIRTPGHGVLRGVHQLPPGHLAQAAPGWIRTYPYWQWTADRYRDDVDTTTGTVRSLLADATRPLREQPAGAVLLSGGIASATAAVFTTPTPSNLGRPAAYTLALDGPWSRPPRGGVDISAAAHTAAHLNLPHRTHTPRIAAVLDAGAATRLILDFPGEAATDAARLALLRHVAVDTATVVTGDGATAVLGDYPWQHHPERLPGDNFPWHNNGLAPVDLLSDAARLYLQPEAYAKHRHADAVADTPYAGTDDATGRAHRRTAYLTLTHYLPARLHRLDQLATAAGLTVTSPFTERQLAEYLFTVPYSVRHMTSERIGLLRHTVADLLPASVTWAPSLPPPAAHLLPTWRRSQREQLRDLLTDRGQPLQPLLDQPRISGLLGQAGEQLPPGWHSSVAYLLDINAWLTHHHITLT